jgi:hypothetical protein
VKAPIDEDIPSRINEGPAEFQADSLYQTEPVRFQLQTEVEENGEKGALRTQNSIQHPGIDTDAQATTYGQNHAFLTEMEAERLLRVLVNSFESVYRACHSNLHASQDQGKRDLFTFNCARNNIIKKHKLSTCQ